MNGKKVGGIALTVFGGIFLFMGLLFGVIFGIVGGAMGGAADDVNAEFEEFAEYAVETTGVVVDAGDGATTVEYEADGDYYQVDYTISTSEFGQGDYISVYYDPDNPYSCMVPELESGAIEMMGGIFSGVGIGVGIFFVILGLAFMIPGIILIKKSKTTYDN